MRESQRVPAVTLLLIGANLAAAFAAAFDPSLPTQFGFDPRHASLSSAFVSLFLHANIVHLLGNMVFLAAVAPSMEQRGRAWQLVLAYFGGGLAGIGAHLLIASRAPGAPIVVGASGAVASCVALYSIRYMRIQVPILPKWTVPIAYVTGLWVALQALGGFVTFGGLDPDGGGTAYWAHVGGFAFGLILSLLVRAPKEASERHGRRVIDAMRDRSPAAALAAAENHLAAHPGDLRALREVADAHARLGDRESERSALVELLQVLPELEQVDVLRRLADISGLDRLPSLHRTLLAERFKGVRPDVSEFLLESVVAGPDHDDQRPDAMLALATLRQESAPGPARKLIDELLSRYPMHPASELARSRGWRT